jgi:hypothetical protein
VLDRAVVEEFLISQLEDLGVQIPQDIEMEKLVEAFCQYVENDYYEWLKDNFEPFFDHGEPDWEWIRDRIRHYTK